MSGYSNSPLVLKGGIVLINAESGWVLEKRGKEPRSIYLKPLLSKISSKNNRGQPTVSKLNF